MNRLDRLTSILIQLQSKKTITAQEIADYFDISLRTVYRDIRSLEEAGVPIGAEAGKGYCLCEGYQLPPVMFTKNEATSMILAEKIIENLTDKSLIENYKSALLKIKSVLNNDEKDFIEALSSSINFNHEGKDAEVFSTKYLLEVQNALAHCNIIKIEYCSTYSGFKSTTREVEPVGLIFYSFAWHLICYCRLRKDYRDFRVDSITNITETGQKFNKSDRITIQEYINRYFDKSRLTPVTITVNKTTHGKIHRSKHYYGFISETIEKDSVTMNFAVYSIDYFSQWIISMNEKIEVINPDSLKTQLKNKIQKLADFYSI